MRCCVPFCRNTSHNVLWKLHEKGETRGISFHDFPSETHLRAVWLGALGIKDTLPLDSAVVCSRHFLNDDIHETESGLRQISAGAIPTTVLVCMVCLQTDCELLLLSKHKLEESYVKLTGYPLHDQRNLKQTVCIQCAQGLTDFSRFREQSLRARSRMMDLVEKHEIITIEHMKMIEHTVLKPDEVCEMVKVEICVEEEHTELDPSVYTVAVKKEECHESDSRLSMDIDFNSGALATRLRDDSLYKSVNGESAVADQTLETQYSIKCESAGFQCTFCFDRFFDEHELNVHESTHLQNDDTSASFSHDSTHLTKNKRAVRKIIDEAHPFTDSICTKSTVISARVSDGDATEQSSDCYNTTDVKNCKVTNCLVELYDVKHPVEAVTIKDEALTATWNVETDTEDPQCATVPDAVSASGHKPDVSSVVQSETDRFGSDVQIEHNGSLDNSFLIERKNINKGKRKSASHLRSHLLTGKKPYTCKFCDYTTAVKSSLVNHMRTHTGEKPYSCKLCEYKAAEKRTLVSHMRTHTGEKPYSCEFCDYKAAEKTSLVSHVRTHTGEKPYSCELCDYRTATKSNLVCHVRTHTGEKPYSCKVCDYRTGSKSHLLCHVRTHTGEKPYSCELCDYRTARNSDLVCHMRTHTGEKPYSCKLCDYKAAEKSTLLSHMTTHTGEKRYSCRLCDYKTAVKSSLVKHLRTHTGEKPYFCKLCDYKAAEKRSLVSHMRTHTGEKPYSCKLCDYKAAEKSSLVSHMRTHTGERPYSCKLCDYRSAAKSNLVCHMRTHTGEKPYACTVCDYRTARNYDLVCHTRTHTGEKPYSCKLCDYRTARNCDLLCHIRTHTGEALTAGKSD